MKNNVKNAYKAVRAVLMGGLLLALGGCNMLNHLPGIQQPAPMSVGGNWQIDLMDSSGNLAAVATGFLQQSGSNLTGGFDVSGCGSSANATGNVGRNNGPNAVNLSLPVDNQTLSIVGSGIGAITPGTAIEGNYTVGAISCPISGLTSIASGQQINSITGTFHGSLQSRSGSTFTVSGSATQGQYASGSSAPVTGTATVTSSSCFSSLTLTGTVSGTSPQLATCFVRRLSDDRAYSSSQHGCRPNQQRNTWHLHHHTGLRHLQRDSRSMLRRYGILQP